jgi:hypothetical protein
MHYRGTYLYIKRPTPEKTIFGIHTAKAGEIIPPSPIPRLVMTKMIKMKDIMKPRAICKPVPPLVFLEETITPIKTRTKTVKGMV